MFSRSNPRSLVNRSIFATFAIAILCAVATTLISAWQLHTSGFDAVLSDAVYTSAQFEDQLASFVEHLPRGLHLAVSKHANVTVNKEKPLFAEVKLNTVTRRVAFEPADMPEQVLRNKYALGNDRVAVHFIISGDKLLVLDTQRLQDDALKNTQASLGLVPLDYRTVHLAHEPAIDGILSALCESYSDAEFEQVLETERLLLAKTETMATTNVPPQRPFLAQRPTTQLSGVPAVSKDLSTQRSVAALDGVSTRRALLHYNATAQQLAAASQGVDVLSYRFLRWADRVGGLRESTKSTSFSSTHLPNAGGVSAGGGYSTTFSGSPLHVAKALSTITDKALDTYHGVPSEGLGSDGVSPLSANYVCTRETVLTALTAARGNPAFQQLRSPWFGTFLLAIVATAKFIAVILTICAHSVSSLIVLAPVLVVATRANVMLGRPKTMHLIKMSIVTSSIMSIWWKGFQFAFTPVDEPLATRTMSPNQMLHNGVTKVVAFITHSLVMLRSESSVVHIACEAIVLLVAIAHLYECAVTPTPANPQVATPIVNAGNQHAATPIPSLAPTTVPVPELATPAQSSRHTRGESTADHSDVTPAKQLRRRREARRLLKECVQLQTQISQTQCAIEKQLHLLRLQVRSRQAQRLAMQHKLVDPQLQTPQPAATAYQSNSFHTSVAPCWMPNVENVPVYCRVAGRVAPHINGLPVVPLPDLNAFGTAAASR
jgi:hypothetical protein